MKCALCCFVMFQSSRLLSEKPVAVKHVKQRIVITDPQAKPLEQNGLKNRPVAGK